MPDTRIANTNWKEERVALRDLRELVFIGEQKVTKELEWDGLDDEAQHFIAYQDNAVVGCARLLDGNKVGRMAVIKSYRGQGIGQKILDHIKRFASQKRTTLLTLSAQCHAYHFYRQSGFGACSSPYEDAGIAHIDMECRVFSLQAELTQYALSLDKTTYHSHNFLEGSGYLEIMLSQCRKSLDISIKDLAHPLLRNPLLIQKILLLARQNRHFKINILLGLYTPTDNDHPLFKIMDRLPSFSEIKISPDISEGVCTVDNTASLNFQGNEYRICFSNTAAVNKHKALFRQRWSSASSIPGARRLSI
ncbi:MAG: GNAT family N-acetyltransferase [Bermanella sp.]